MIIPSIDLMGGSAIQLVGGKGKGVVSLEPFFAAAKFSLAGRMAVIDLDAAFNKGDNSEIVKELVSKYRCNVGGGIRTADEAMDWLQSGADKVILGTAATPEILKQLPRDKVIAALDIKNDVVMVDGWRKSTDHAIENRILRLKDYVDEFLVTFIECEGRMDGTRLERALELSALAQPARLIIAGGITSEMEINYLDKFNMDAQVGMALYTGGLHLADAIGAPLTRNSIATVEGLWPTVICDESGVALGLAYSSKESLRQAVDNLRGVYYSRSRNSIWEKGKTSGNIQHLRRIDLDCDRDTLRFVVSLLGR
jgi:phosphoribosylformimino-5-aminoimidazole carboxamide ribonucleotide (ProFAR) isomerase